MAALAVLTFLNLQVAHTDDAESDASERRTNSGVIQRLTKRLSGSAGGVGIDGGADPDGWRPDAVAPPRRAPAKGTRKGFTRVNTEEQHEDNDEEDDESIVVELQEASVVEPVPSLQKASDVRRVAETDEDEAEGNYATKGADISDEDEDHRGVRPRAKKAKRLARVAPAVSRLD